MSIFRWPRFASFLPESLRGPDADGSYDFLRRPGFLAGAVSSVAQRTIGFITGKTRAKWARQSFRGNPDQTVTAIDTSGGIVVSGRTSGTNPFFVHVSAANITATGCDRPYEDLEFRWNFGDTNGIETFTEPSQGKLVNANTDQVGPEAAYVYRRAGSYTITLTVRGKNGSGFTTATTTSLVVQNITRVSLGSPSSGTYTITVGATTTAAIAFDATAPVRVAAIDTALGPGKVRYAGGNCFEFIGTLSGTDPTVTIDSTLLVGGTVAVSKPFTGSTASGITVTEYAGSGGDFWYDGTSGSDSNDGLDPNGFALTGATYTTATNAVTKAGAFASYNHTSASAPIDPWERWNYVYLSGGTGITAGLYRILSRVSDDTIILASSAGAQDNVNTTSSSGPKLTAAHWATQQALTTSNTRFRFRRGGTYGTSTSSIAVYNGSGRRHHAYGPSALANPILQYTGSSATTFLVIRKGDDKVFSNLDFDGGGILTTDIVNAGSGNVELGRWNYFDGVRAYGLISGTGNLWDFNAGPATNNLFAYGLWNSAGIQATGGVRASLFAYITSWGFLFGSAFAGTGTNNVLDHHVYYDQQGNYGLLRWLDFGPTTLRNFCINGNCSDAIGGVSQFFNVSECDCTYTLRWLDLSNSNNDRTLNGSFSNVKVEGNAAHGMTGDAISLYANADTVTFFDNVMYGNTGSRCFNANDKASGFRFYLNKIHHTGAGYAFSESQSNTTARVLKYNDIQVPTAAPAQLVSFTGTTGLTADSNRYRADNDPNGRFSVASVNKTFAQWQGLGFDAAGTLAGPVFVDPANGNWLPG